MLAPDELAFISTLLNWHSPDYRPLPWKNITDPYLIWLSEIILQQTRAEQGLPYFLRFQQAYPTVSALARAPLDEVLKLWEGLGYYSRARNLHTTARFIADELNGHFPSNYTDILALKGVGAYTAAAIASFAYGLPHAVVDGNVYRVLARYFDLNLPIDGTAGKRYFDELAQRLLPPAQAAVYNQAIMDFGATVCTPKNPQCRQCPLNAQCAALQAGTLAERPVKAKKIKRKERYFHYIKITTPDRVLLHQRTEKDIWQQLYQFVLLEHDAPIEQWDTLATLPQWPQWLPPQALRCQRKAGPYVQDLTHQRIIARVWEADWLLPDFPELPAHFYLANANNWRNFAFPKVIGTYMADNSPTLF